MDSTKDVESPFLSGEPIDREAGEGLPPRAEMLAMESVFQRAFESSAVGLDRAGDEENPSAGSSLEPAGRPEPHSEDEATAEEEDGEEVELSEREVDHEAEGPFFVEIIAALARGDWAPALDLWIKAGTHDETKLTNLLFFARHRDLNGRLDPNHPKFRELSREWLRMRDREVTQAIRRAARNASLAVSGEDVTELDRSFRGAEGRRFKALVEGAARKIGFNPGLLAAIALAETRGIRIYLTADKVKSYHVGVDDFYERRRDIAARVPAYADVRWDTRQTPETHLNDADAPRNVRTIKFDSGPAALLAVAVYVKYTELKLIEIATGLGGTFSQLPLESRWALIRIGVNAGVFGTTKGARPRLARALKGEDFLVRDWSPRRAKHTERNAAIHTARAIHLADWIFGKPVETGTRRELESSEATDTFARNAIPRSPVGVDREGEDDARSAVGDEFDAEVDVLDGTLAADDEESRDGDESMAGSVLAEEHVNAASALVPATGPRTATLWEARESPRWEHQHAAPQINWCQLRQAIAATARAEETRWTGPGAVKLLESQPQQLAILTQYWSAVPGFSTAAAAQAAARQSANDQPGWEWSAAFICFVMHTAGVLPAHGFVFSRRHLTYIVGALRNRERSDEQRPFWLVDHVEVQAEAVPQPGDLLCLNRCRPAQGTHSPGCPPRHVRTRHSYDTLRTQYWVGGNQNAPVRGSAHCAIVVGSVQQGGQHFVETIGGNERNSVRVRRVPVDAQGGIANPQAHHIFGMIKLMRC